MFCQVFTLLSSRSDSMKIRPATTKTMEKTPRSEDMAAPEMVFQSKELEQLLDMIDQLRAQGISRIIDLPQMIVCGDQSSGKSSVLEAISGIHFPTKDNLCTRFPTELILRRSPETSTLISIVPDDARNDEEKTKLKAFKAGSEALEDFGAIIDAASQAMGLNRNSKVFSNDVLRVELKGPGQPHLTLVDLPGLFHAGNKNQSDEDAEAIKTLVIKYMAKSRSIILAVVSAKNDYANQIVTRYAQDVDPTGDRTLGIITKPDTLHPGSESEKQFFELAENKDVKLRLGWHVLKNRDFDTKDCSVEERDQAEAAFFNKGIWSSLKPAQKGIGSLRPRLGRLLRDHNISELPEIMADTEAGITECKARLELLGEPRSTNPEQRIYLHSISQKFSKLIRDAVSGNYQDEFFQNKGSVSGLPKRIRAVVFNRLDEFRVEIEAHGHEHQIVPTEPALQESIGSDGEGIRDKYPVYVTREARLTMVENLIKTHRGLELPGLSKHEIITTLFRQQCSPWTDIVNSYAQRIFGDVRAALYHGLDTTSDSTTKDGIVRVIIDPALNKIEAGMNLRIKQNLKQHISGQPLTFNQYFTENVQKLRQEHHTEHLQSRLLAYFGRDEDELHEQNESRFCVADLAAALTQSTREDNLKFTCSEALHYMEAYYKVALKFFIDDFSIHTVEQGLLEPVESIFNPSKIFTLDDKTIEEIAGETQESQVERQSSTARLAALSTVSDALHKLNHAHPKGFQ